MSVTSASKTDLRNKPAIQSHLVVPCPPASSGADEFDLEYRGLPLNGNADHKGIILQIINVEYLHPSQEGGQERKLSAKQNNSTGENAGQIKDVSSERAFEREARALLARNISNGDRSLCEDATRVITVVLSDYQEGQPEKIRKLAAIADGKMIAAKKVDDGLQRADIEPTIGKAKKTRLSGAPAKKSSSILPKKAPELWPGKLRSAESVPDFVRRVWGKHFAKGITRSDLHNLDDKIIGAINQYRRDNNGAWPADLNFIGARKKGSDVVAVLETQGIEALTPAALITAGRYLQRLSVKKAEHS